MAQEVAIKLVRAMVPKAFRIFMMDAPSRVDMRGKALDFSTESHKRGIHERQVDFDLFQSIKMK